MKNWTITLAICAFLVLSAEAQGNRKNGTSVKMRILLLSEAAFRCNGWLKDCSQNGLLSLWLLFAFLLLQTWWWLRWKVYTRLTTKSIPTRNPFLIHLRVICDKESPSLSVPNACLQVTVDLHLTWLLRQFASMNSLCPYRIRPTILSCGLPFDTKKQIT